MSVLELCCVHPLSLKFQAAHASLSSSLHELSTCVVHAGMVTILATDEVPGLQVRQQLLTLA